MPDGILPLLSHFYIELDGSTITDELKNDILEVEVECSLHLPDVALIRIHDPRLRWIDDARLEPGRTLKVSARVDKKTKLLFDGEIVEAEPNFVPGTQRFLIRAFDRLHRLARGRQARTFVNVTDGDIVQKIASEVGLSANVGPARTVHPHVLQSNQTNLEFLQERARAVGYLLYVEGKTLYFQPPGPGRGSMEVAWNETLTTFRPRMTTVDQIGTVTARGWDPDTKKAVVGQAKNGNSAPKIGESRKGGELAKKAFGLNAPYLVADRPLRSQGVAERLAQAVADERAGKFIEAEGSCSGDPGITAGGLLTIRNVGNRYSGDYLVTAVTHIFSTSDEGYRTEFAVSGHFPATLAHLLTPVSEGPPPVGYGGVVVGIVTDNKDPEGRGRVKVEYPWLSEEHTSFWARLATPGGGPNRGLEFLPEINDEVIIAFEQGDMNHPYVLGGLWNGKDAAPRKSSEIVVGGKVEQRLIKSRTGHLFIFDDKEGAGGITIQDRKGNIIKIESAQDMLTIEVTGNALVKAKDIKVQASGRMDLLSQTGMTIETKGKLEMKSTSAMSIETMAKLDVKSQTGMSLETTTSMDLKSQSGMNLETSARLQAKGMAGTSVTSPAIVEIQGSLVKIN